MQEIKDEDFITFEREINSINFDQMMQIFHNAGIFPKFGFKTKNWMTSISIVSEGFGVSIIPKSFSKIQMKNVVLVDLIDNKIKSKSSLIWKAVNTRSKEIFLSYCKKNIQKTPSNIQENSA